MEDREKALAEAKKQSEELNKRFDELLDKLEKVGGLNQSYSKDSVVEVPGPLFASFINFVSMNKKTLEQVTQTMEAVTKHVSDAIEIALIDSQQMTVAVMEQHIKLVEQGKTSSPEEMDKEDAEHKVQKIK